MSTNSESGIRVTVAPAPTNKPVVGLSSKTLDEQDDEYVRPTSGTDDPDKLLREFVKLNGKTPYQMVLERNGKTAPMSDLPGNNVKKTAADAVGEHLHAHPVKNSDCNHLEDPDLDDQPTQEKNLIEEPEQPQKKQSVDPSGDAHGQPSEEPEIKVPELDYEKQSPESLVDEASRVIITEQVVGYVIAKLKQDGHHEKAVKLLKKGDPEKAVNVLRKYIPQNMRLFRQAFKNDLSGKRTRFFVKYAASHGPRMSALLFLIAVCTRQEYKRGKRGEKCCWHSTADKLGRQIGVSQHQIFKMLDTAKAAKLLNFGKTTRGIRVWLTKRDVYVILNSYCKADPDKNVIGFYDLRLSALLGINGAIMYCFLKQKTDDCGEQLTYAPDSMEHRFQWINKNAARCALERLYAMGAISRKKSAWHMDRGRIGWRYFWKPRGELERAKWKAYWRKPPKRLVPPTTWFHYSRRIGCLRVADRSKPAMRVRSKRRCNTVIFNDFLVKR